MTCRIEKADDHAVFGWAWVSDGEDGTRVTDSQGDSIPPEELEQAAYDHVLTFRSAGAEHDPARRGVGVLIESMVFTPEKLRLLGLTGLLPVGWWVGYRITDEEVWQAVKRGEYGMFSIEGEAVREEET